MLNSVQISVLTFFKSKIRLISFLQIYNKIKKQFLTRLISDVEF